METFACTNCGNDFTGNRHTTNKDFFCSPNCCHEYQKGENHPRFKEGRIVTGDGRIMLRCIDHPKADNRRYVYQYILIAEQALGKYLPKGCITHHAGSIEDDHFIVICQDDAYHKLLHARKRILELGGDPNTQNVCSKCQTIKEKIEFPKTGNICRDCYRKSKRELYKERRQDA